MKNSRRIRIVVPLLGCCLVLLHSISSGFQSLELKQADKVQMLRLGEGDPRAFFRMDLNIVDETGKPHPLDRPKGNIDLKKSIEIVEAGNKGNPFYPFYFVFPEIEQTSTEPIRREMMLLFDVSGSMNQPVEGGGTRFETAKRGLTDLLQNFEDGVDTISIVPFASRRVVESIQGGTFVGTRSEAERQVAELPKPEQHGNTALYSAARAALGLLEKRQIAERSRQYMLIILTDGKNDVGHSGDDKDLLGDNGLDAIKEDARRVRIAIYTVGFGTPGADFDPNALQQMAYPDPTNYISANNSSRLREAFRVARQSLVERVRITFFTNRENYQQLSKASFKVRFKTPLPSIQSRDIDWSSAISGPAPEAELDAGEREAWIKSNPPPPTSFWKTTLRRLVVFALFCGALALCWYLPPLLIWPRPRLPHIPGASAAGIRRPRLPSRSALGARPRSEPPRQTRDVQGTSARRSGDDQDASRKGFEKTVVLKNKGKRAGSGHDQNS